MFSAVIKKENTVSFNSMSREKKIKRVWSRYDYDPNIKVEMLTCPCCGFDTFVLVTNIAPTAYDNYTQAAVAFTCENDFSNCRISDYTFTSYENAQAAVAIDDYFSKEIDKDDVNSDYTNLLNSGLYYPGQMVRAFSGYYEGQLVYINQIFEDILIVGRPDDIQTKIAPDDVSGSFS